MAAVGIGNTKVDAVLESDTVRAGETLIGKIHLQGGNVSQDLSALHLDLVSYVEKEVDDETVKVPHTWATLPISEPMTVEPGDTLSIDFEIPMPLLAPLPIGRQQPKTWLATRADVAMAIDPRDRDALSIQPGDIHQAVLGAMERLGFTLTEAPLKAWKMNALTGCVQEFEFKPRRGAGFDHLDEVEVAFLPSAGGVLDILVKRDTKARGLGSMFAEMTGMDEIFSRLTLREGMTTSDVQESLQQVLR
ncbi:sporulation protein [Halomonas sp. I5-271120]|uniref:sporulation protein n=1 Tax=Halomonas sp. I5-271120 TaxID=3061632 RepID=UPI002714FE82|nr:sporulation protein [Halomonas sp. I5-271120]